ncbi:isoprenoid biosynthesis enzyme family protein [Kitasatospora purpeofusca]|uniref:hypothetical protein n=1 Tax=Kitasatospora purpeofusca TaxID=67352 RepID=UPI00364A1734
MDPTVRPLLRHPLPPGVDTLRHTARRGLDAIPDPRHRAMIASVLSSGLVEQMIARTDSFTAPPADLAQAAADADLLTAELAAFGVDLPAATVRNITQMRALMVPIADDALALAVDRIWVFSTNADDVCCHDPDEAAAMLRAGLLPEALPASPNTRYVRHMFHEIAPFCEPTFLAVFKSFFHNALTGVLMEAEFDPEASDGVDSDYVRVFNGFSQFWFVTLQFTDPCLAAHRNRAFWAAAMSSCVAFLNDVNDVLSCYKEAVHGADFAVSRVYRKVVREDIPYLTAYRRTLDGGLAAHRRITGLATEEQRPYLDRYMTGYAYWHLHCRRYRWQDVYPDLLPLDGA